MRCPNILIEYPMCHHGVLPHCGLFCNIVGRHWAGQAPSVFCAAAFVKDGIITKASHLDRQAVQTHVVNWSLESSAPGKFLYVLL